MTNKPEVKRYDMSVCPDHICRVFNMEESEDGDFVEWEAYEALQAEYEKLRKDAEPDVSELVEALEAIQKASTIKGIHTGAKAGLALGRIEAICYMALQDYRRGGEV